MMAEFEVYVHDVGPKIPIFYDEKFDRDLAIQVRDYFEDRNFCCYDEHRDCNLGESIFESLENLVTNSEKIIIIISEKSERLLWFKTQTSLISVINDVDKRKKIIPIYRDMDRKNIPVYLQPIKGLHFTTSNGKTEEYFWEKIDNFLTQLKKKNSGFSRPQLLPSLRTREEPSGEESLASIDSGIESSLQDDSSVSSDNEESPNNTVSSSTASVSENIHNDMQSLTLDAALPEVLTNSVDLKHVQKKKNNMNSLLASN